MIRLIINAQSTPEIHLFNKSPILIGHEPSEVDLALPHLNLQPIHLKIAKENGSWILFNVTNDPFVSVNDQPLGRKTLSTNDLICIQDFYIRFENLEETSNHVHPSTHAEQQTSSHPSIDEKVISDTTPFIDIDLPFEQEIKTSHSSKSPLNTQDVHLTTHPKITPSDSSKHSYQPPTNKTNVNKNSFQAKHHIYKAASSLKDDYLKDLEDDNQKFILEDEPSHLYQAWKWILLFIFSIITIAGIIGTVIYFSISDKTEAQETKAAQGVADVAIALTHAQLYHLKPNNQNWSDVDFLKTNLQALIPNASSYVHDIDAHGQFKRFPYSLRIYTSTDLSRFLLIAQPAPNLLQWLIPKSVILVDSQSMELRTIKDIRNLNRLLANPDPLDGVNGKEISALVKQGQLIHLSTLAYDANQPDFAPPKNIVSVKPGVEDLIYNAPRYYRLSQSLIQKALALSKSKGSSKEVVSFKREVEAFSKLSHLVLYTDQGKEAAAQTRLGLSTFAPSDKLLFGYIELNDKNEIKQAFLLKDEDQADAYNHSIIALNQELTKEPAEQDPKTNEMKSTVDINHPIYVKLKLLTQNRENELKPLASALIESLHKQNIHPEPSFQTKFQDIVHQYLMADVKHQVLIKDTIREFYQQYDEIPLERFMAFVNESGCGTLIQQNDSSFELRDENCAQNLETLFTQIQNAKSFIELDHLIHMADSWLTFDYIKNAKELSKYQNLLRNKVLNQLEKLILSNKKRMNFDRLAAEERETLKHILSYERILKPEEQDFFLEEFERLDDQNGEEEF